MASEVPGNKDFHDYPQAITHKKSSLENFMSWAAIIIGGGMALFAANKFISLLDSSKFTATAAAFCCTAFLAGALLIGIALAMVFSRAAAERKMKFNWYKDQLDDYLARKDRASNNTRTQ